MVQSSYAFPSHDVVGMEDRLAFSVHFPVLAENDSVGIVIDHVRPSCSWQFFGCNPTFPVILVLIGIL